MPRRYGPSASGLYDIGYYLAMSCHYVSLITWVAEVGVLGHQNTYTGTRASQDVW